MWRTTTDQVKIFPRVSPDDQAVSLVTMVRGNTMLLVSASRQNLFLVSTGSPALCFTALSPHYCLGLTRLYLLNI